jgi:hypothetical protein
MHSEKALMHKAADRLIKKAADCFDIAEAQHYVAEKQHESASRQHCNADALEANANKLDGIGHALEADAAEIYGSTKVGAREMISPIAPAVDPLAPKAGVALRYLPG